MTTTNPHRSHIDDIIGLIDRVLGPDDGGPVPTPEGDVEFEDGITIEA